MNDTQKEYKKEFLDRLFELGLVEEIHFKTQNLGDGVMRISAEPNPQFETLQVAHMIMGMIYHFKSRKWITDSGYTFIMKSVHNVLFNDGTIETL
jgi:hypothetical protein